MSSETTRSVSAAEIPKPMLSPPPELITATTSPLRSTSGPPLLPGLTGASVWIASGISKPAGEGIERLTPLTMPLVIVPSRL
jgi:hypothetical protein